ncbi:MAG TPA: sulfurtransferase [Spirillospora sp.]|nr:sulfurtransferase [Spirillospora sp.]
MKPTLVTTQWVEANLHNPAVRIAEISVETSLYDTEHVPGAVNFSWTTQLQDTVRRDIISQADFEALLSQAGITPETHVVLYGDNNNWFAAYGFWIFKYYGHENVSLMDGGVKRWKLDRRPMTADVPTYPATQYKVTKINTEYRADRDYVKARLGNDHFGLVDVRSPAEYAGEIIAPPGMSETAQRAGHIPGAINLPWSLAVAEDGTYKPREELLKLYADKGLEANEHEIITYCRIGERSSHTWVVLKYLLGFQHVRNYDGSWTEWGNLIGSPIQKGEQP